MARSLKILVVSNSVYPRGNEAVLDTSIPYIYNPLTELGHSVYFFDTVGVMGDPQIKNNRNTPLLECVRSCDPDVIFCCLTGNKFITPVEPSVEEIRKITDLGYTTFNWFCDDTWRFEDFSKIYCKAFTYCSTPEKAYIPKYKEIGYDNILLGGWHASQDMYNHRKYKDNNVVFVGGISGVRQKFFDSIKTPISFGQNLQIDQMCSFLCGGKIGLNLSVNDNDPKKGTQMKQRIFELAAAQCLILSEHHDGISDFFDIGEEVITFRTPEEFDEKARYYLDNPEEAKTIAQKAHDRFTREHESKIRLTSILEQING